MSSSHSMRTEPPSGNLVDLELPVLGVRVRFTTNAAPCLAAIEQTFGAWRALAAWPDAVGPHRVRVTVIVEASNPLDRGHPPMSFRLPDRDRAVLWTPGSAAAADARRGEAVAYVTPELVSDAGYFGYGMLQALTLLLASKRDRQPLHAAALRRGDVALLLAAPAGTGKSSVAYRASRDGLELLADDAVYVQLQPTPKLWGMPGRAYVPADVASRFPELAGQEPQLLPSGKRKTCVALGGAWRRPPTARTAGVCLLERRGGAATLEEVAADAVAHALRTDLAPQRKLYVATLDEAVAWVAGEGGWRINLTDDPGDAVPLIRRVFDALDARAPSPPR